MDNKENNMIATTESKMKKLLCRGECWWKQRRLVIDSLVLVCAIAAGIYVDVSVIYLLLLVATFAVPYMMFGKSNYIAFDVAILVALAAYIAGCVLVHTGNGDTNNDLVVTIPVLFGLVIGYFACLTGLIHSSSKNVNACAISFDVQKCHDIATSYAGISVVLYAAAFCFVSHKFYTYGNATVTEMLDNVVALSALSYLVTVFGLLRICRKRIKEIDK